MEIERKFLHFFYFNFFFSFRSDADCHLLDINFIVLC